jgi:hypothetical protein
MMLPHIARAQLFPEKDFENWTGPKASENDPLAAIRGSLPRQTARPPPNFDYAVPAHGDDPVGQPRHALPKTTMEWDAKKLKFTNVSDAQSVRSAGAIAKAGRSKDFRAGRREFIQRTGLGAAGVWLAGCRTAPRRISANEKLNIGIIGVANQGGYDMNNVAGENIVALCDVDENFLAAAKRKFPAAKTYNDFRQLLNQRDIDAVVVATPDHTHAVATAARVAQRSPRLLREASHAHNFRMPCRDGTGAQAQAHHPNRTQIHSGENYHRVVDLIQRGEVGAVNEVHVWVNATYGGKDMPKARPPVPASLHYDLWLGPLPDVPYHPDFVPRWWRQLVGVWAVARWRTSAVTTWICRTGRSVCVRR